MPAAGYKPDSGSFNTGDEPSRSTRPLGGGDSNTNKASSYNIQLIPSYQSEAELLNYKSVPKI